MKKIYIILLILVPFFALEVSAQKHENYEALYKKELARNDSLMVVLQSLEKQKKELSDTISKTKRNIDTKNGELKKLESLHTFHLNSPQYKEYQAKKKQLSKLEHEIESLTEEIDSLSNQVSLKKKEIGRLKGSVSGLKTTKDDIIKQLSEEYKRLISQPFSKMKMDELDAFISRCNEYSSEAKVKTLISRVKQFRGYKQTYDEALQICNSKFDRAKITHVRSRLVAIKLDNKLQQLEIDKVCDMLSRYEEGMQVFKEFVVQINNKREGVSVYSKDDLNDDLERILSKNNLKERIESIIMSVPYLSKTYKEYIKALEANPQSHPEIEREVLSFSK